MPDNETVLYGVAGQSLYLDASEGRPDSVISVTVLPWNSADDGAAEAATTGSASVETDPDTTFDAASGFGQADPTLLSVAATTGIEPGRLLLATNAAGEREWVDVSAVTAGASCNSRTPLHNAYTSSDTLESTRITISVDDTWAADETNIADGTDPNPGYRVRWVYIVDGVTYIRFTYFDLSRVNGDHNVTAAEIERLVPGFLGLIPRGHRADAAQALIDEAYKEFQLDLLGVGIPDQQVRNQDVVDNMVKRKAMVVWTESRVLVSADDGNLDAAELAAKTYQVRFDSLFRAPSQAKVNIADSSSGAGAKVSATSITVR